MFRLLIMFFLGVSGVFFETSGVEASPMETMEAEMMSMTNDAEDVVLKSKRHNLHPGIPCPLHSHQHSGTYLPPSVGFSEHYGPPAYQKPVIIPSYHHVPKVASIGYQKPVIPKIIYQSIKRPAAYNIQPAVVKPQVHYVHPATYVPIVKEQPISYVKPVTPTVSYDNVHLVNNYARPVHEIQPIHTINPVKTFVKEIPCDIHGPPSVPNFIVKPIEKPVMPNSYYTKPLFQPAAVSYYPKPIPAPSHKLIFQNPHPVKTVKVLPAVPEPDCDKIYQPKVSYVKIPQLAVPQHVNHQPMFQYAAKYHQPIFQQPMINFHPKIHQPILENTHMAQPAVAYVHTQHSAAPAVNLHGGYHYQSPIISGHQPCHH